MYKLMFIFSFAMLTAAYSQNQTNEVSRQSLSLSDSLKENIEKLNTFRSKFFTLRQKFFNDKLTLSQSAVSYSTWMLKSGFNSENIAPLLQHQDMVRSYKMLYGADDDLKYVHMVLGMAQTATVGVLAYKHIKKYGLFSK